MSSLLKAAFVFPLLLAACAADQSHPSAVETKTGALGETISTDHASYQPGATITVSYAGLPGNYHDWIAIAPAGSPFTTHVAFVFTFGQTSGTATFIAPAAGSYVARAFANDDEILLAETATFTVSAPATISTDHSSYTSGSTITVSYAGLPGNYHDWIAIAPAGSPFTTHVAFVFTFGQTSGTATFSAPANGSYVARAFANDDEILIAESAPFTVGTTATISTNQSSYAPGATITVSYAGLPGNYHDWIAIASAGSPLTSHVAFVFTFGQTSGTATFIAPAAGSYVARAFANDDEILLAESAPFAVGTTATISTDKSNYGSGSTITVSYAGLPGNYHDWIAIASVGSPLTSHVAFVFTFGQTSGTATFTAPAPGSYVARAFANDDEILLAQSASFTVGATVSTDKTSYGAGATVTVTYANLPGNLHDWIAIAQAGSPLSSHVAFVFTNGQTSGTASFFVPAVGSYVARAFANDDEILLAESAPFTVGVTATISTDKSSYIAGSSVTVSYSGLPGNMHDWITIAPAGAPLGTHGAFYFTNGQQSGTAVFSAPAPGSYVARAFANDDEILLAESASFTVTALPPATVSTDQSTYAPGATITVSYTGLPGFAYDWIGIAPADSPDTTYLSFVYTNGQQSGTATFTVGASGLYVARAFIDNGYYLAAESAVFSVCGDTGGTLCFVATLSGNQEVPANASTASGSGTVVFDPNTLGITYQLHQTVTGASAGHIHQSPPGTSGSVIVPFTLVGQGASGTAVLSQAQADDLVAGNLYMNVHSPAFSLGEIRGQLMKPGELLFVANLTGAQQTTPNASTATGTGSVIFDPATNGIKYRLHQTVVNANAAHIHQAPAGMDGSVIVPFTLVGQDASGTATLSASEATALQAAGCYMNVHSPTFPVGEIRGQLLPPGS